jgi:REP element-mobilizing transposase RayT
VVFCPKYRKPVLNPPIDAKLKKLIRQVCDETQSALIEMEVMPDHVHLLVGCDPQYGIHRLVPRGVGDRSMAGIVCRERAQEQLARGRGQYRVPPVTILTRRYARLEARDILDARQ